MDPTYPLLPLLNFLVAFLVLSTIPTIRQSPSLGILFYAIWISSLCFIRGINSIIWADNVEVVAKPWCDFTTRMEYASNTAIPACSLAITRSVYNAVHMRSVMTSNRKKRSETIINLILCLVLPLLSASLYYVIQVKRSSIIEETGCSFTTDANQVAIVIFYFFPITMSAASMLYYCPLILWKLLKHRKEINEFLDSGVSLNRKNYHRIVILSCMDAIMTFPLTVFALYQTALKDNGIYIRWPGWEASHAQISQVTLLPATVWRQSSWAIFCATWNQIVYVFCASVFFAFFGFTEEAFANYRWAIRTVMRAFGIPIKPEEPTNAVPEPIRFERPRTTTDIESSIGTAIDQIWNPTASAWSAENTASPLELTNYQRKGDHNTGDECSENVGTS